LESSSLHCQDKYESSRVAEVYRLFPRRIALGLSLPTPKICLEVSMIGDGWDGGASIRPGEFDDAHAAEGRVLRICAVTGSRAEFGLMRPVMLAIAQRPELELAVVAAGSHLVSPAHTFYDVKQSFAIADIVPMQVAGRTGQAEDVQSLARGVARFGRTFEKLRPDWTIVLGDRIEAFAAGLAASIGGIGLLHIHGGDRAEGISDEAIRHSLSKLAHVHFAATEQSAQRLISMGEDAWRVHNVGSPSIDELFKHASLNDEIFAELGSPQVVMLMHPIGRSAEQEEAGATAVLQAIESTKVPALLLAPNLDPGRDGIMMALRSSTIPMREHLPRPFFVGLLRRIAAAGGCLVGNSSAGLRARNRPQCGARRPRGCITNRKRNRTSPHTQAHCQHASLWQGRRGRTHRRNDCTAWNAYAAHAAQAMRILTCHAHLEPYAILCDNTFPRDSYSFPQRWESASPIF
jgi:UDP-hydrolysing UDP-N-acetyl-D-glucosamine 2-epimerase